MLSQIKIASSYICLTYDGLETQNVLVKQMHLNENSDTIKQYVIRINTTT